MDVRLELPDDRADIHAVLAGAFETTAEADLTDALRNSGLTEISLVAAVDSEIVGYALFSAVHLQTAGTAPRIISLAPMAVLPNSQRQGVGRQLLETGLEAARNAGWQVAVVLGHPEYYSQFGFSAEAALPLTNPFGAGPFWMALELQPGALTDVTGTIEYPEPFKMFE